MERPQGPPPRVVVVAAATVVAVALGLSAAMAFSRPFTAPSEVLTATALALLLAVIVLQQIGRPMSPLVARREAPTWSAGTPGGLPGQRGWAARWSGWMVLVAATAGWELFSYLSSPRHTHPTLSSMLDAVTAHHAGRGLAYALWLVLGWYLVTR